MNSVTQPLHSTATRRALDPRPQILPRVVPRKPRRQELEFKLAELQKDYAALHTAIFEAAQVHRRLCAPRLLNYQDFEIASEIFAVRHLPGDFFTVEEANGEIILALGDICGKGLSAGMWTTHVAGLVRAHTSRTTETEEIMTQVNVDLVRMLPLRPFASLFLANLNPMTGVLHYSSAGHPPALVLRADGALERLCEGGLLLGVLADAVYARGVVQLHAGDMLVVYSDGIIESLNNAGEEFGYERLNARLRESQTDSADSVLFSVLGAVQDFAGTRPLIDDMSLAVVRRANALAMPNARAA
jgi:sigma-B regulation protein RsbU (phosphoserine phosphatase)